MRIIFYIYNIIIICLHDNYLVHYYLRYKENYNMVFLILKGQCQRYPSFDGSLRFSFPLFLLFDGIRNITSVLSSDDQAKMKEIVSVLFVVSISISYLFMINIHKKETTFLLLHYS